MVGTMVLISYNREYGPSSHSKGDRLGLPQEPSIVGSNSGALLRHFGYTTSCIQRVWEIVLEVCSKTWVNH